MTDLIVIEGLKVDTVIGCFTWDLELCANL